MESIDRVLIVNKERDVMSATPVQLYDRVMANSQNPGSNWEFSASELYRVTSTKGFPLHYAKEIQMAVLNLFTSLELDREFKASEESQNAVNAIYSKLMLMEDENEDLLSKSARGEYLASIIEKATMLAISNPIYPIDKYEDCKDKWRKERFEEYENIYGINFTFLLEILIKDYQKYIKSLQESGILLTDERLVELEEKNRNVLIKMIKDM